MSSVLLPAATAALSAATTALESAKVAGPLGSGYATGISPAVTALPTVITNATAIQVVLPKVALTTPPFKCSIGSCQAVIALVVQIQTAIAATTTQSVAALGLPSPTFIPSAAAVVAQCTTLVGQIQTLLVLPNK